MEKAPDLQPTLEGPRVIVRPMIAEDWEHMYAIAADPLLWEQHPAKNRYEEVQFREYFEAAMASESAFTFIEKANGSIIGSSRYHGYDS
ncbi:MAG TPA: GNAT family N-acetyltransferase, partial [Gammaproteobacteria bacterium]|nr:GNAT family N-acetyltransferase [Gammaproteobacteria bacterium]